MRWLSTVVFLATIKCFSTHSFKFRAWCETGQLLDFPDVGFYSPHPPHYLNDTRLDDEINKLTSLIDGINKLDMNAFVLFQPSIEDYITYHDLDPSLYPPQSEHAIRASALVAAVNKALGQFKEANLETYLAVFEPTYPIDLVTSTHLNLTVLGPDLEHFLQVKYSELFAGLTNLDGVMVYTADNWGDRGNKNYYFPRENPVWHNGKELATLAAMLQSAIQNTTTVNKKLILSLWEGADLWQEFSQAVPPNLTAMVHLTSPGFRLSGKFNPVIVQGGARVLSQLYISVDPFREHDGGWTRMVSVPSQKWQQGFELSLANNVSGVMAFANWGPSWSWPNFNSHSFLINCTGENLPKCQSGVSWAGRFALLRADPYVDSSPLRAQEAAAILIAALASNVSCNSTQVLSQWFQTILFLNSTSADVLASSFLLSEKLWMEYQQDSGSINWQTLFNPHGNSISVSGSWNDQLTSLQTIKNVSSQMLRKAHAVITGATTQEAEMLRALQLTEGYLTTFATFRAAAWLYQNPGFNGSNWCMLQSQTLSILSDLFSHWDSTWASDSEYFQVTKEDPRLWIRPMFMRADNNRTMAAWTSTFFQPQLTKRCSSLPGPF
eukprot:m.11565 g.11565  ORF g.11565 m.11565 type:complete len:608 (-) comp7751_c0_seq1:118-1941(-)